MFEDHTATDVFIGPMKSALSKPSRVSELLDGIKVAAVSPDKSALSAGPSSSSPIPRSKAWSERKEIHQASPLGAKDRYVTGVAAIMEREAPRLQLQPEENDTTISQKSDSTSSDYGDFDADQFDESFLAVLESNQTSIQTSQSPATGTHPERRPINTQDSPVTATKSSIMPTADAEDDDEFANSDEEMFAADFEEILSKYDTLPASAGNQSALRPGELTEEKGSNIKTVADIADSDDEYGDDLNDADFAVAEASATQALQNSASCFSNVRTKYP